MDGGGLLEEGIWVALLLSPVLLVGVRGLAMVIGGSRANTNDLLLWAMAMAAGIALWYLPFVKLVELESGSSVTTRHRFGSGIVGSGLFVGSIVGGTLVGGIVGGTLVGGIVGGGLFVGSIVVGTLVGGIVVGRGGGHVRIRFPVHPLKALASSLFSICIVGAIQRDASSSFLEAIQTEGLEGFKLLGFVAFNVFADAVSLLETLWVLRYGSNARVPKLLGLLALDLVLSAMIFLFLPIVLWEIPAFLEAALFRGDRPWLGILFWSTFATSVLFYLFVIAALLVRPLAVLARGFHVLSRPFDLEAHPVRCISIAMSLVVTVGFIAGGVVQALVGSSGVTPPP